MREEKYQPKMPDIMEAIFDAGYLIFDLWNINIDSLWWRCISFST